jgi:hypothetical protein
VRISATIIDMTILEFDQSPLGAFGQGFARGLASPLELFVVNRVPGIPKPAPIKVVKTTVKDALSGDWARIGNDLRAAIVNGHEQQIAATTPSKIGANQFRR